FLGLSVVRYHGLRKEKKKLFLDISELDLLDGTPVVDIKPYVPYSDSLTDVSSGFIQFAEKKVVVRLTPEVEASCLQYKKETNRDLRTLICEVLGQDPRPASQRQQEREYGMLLWDRNIRWHADEVGFTVFSVESVSG
ncbi:MAG: SAM-dependent methyltransferase, partial [Desulfocapsa sp.]|nr:SAM-dependent methyltransferase [Desulfocapsa sp.]